MFTNEDIVKLRKRTNAGIMDCKNALTESDGDLDKATEWLREKGIAKAAKKADRIAAEGLVYSYIHMGGKIGVLEEINCETDFVARSDNFVAFCKDIALQIAAAKPEYLNREEVPQDVVSHEMEILKAEFGEKLEIKDYVKTMDDYSYNFDVKKEISYDGIIVGSDIVDFDFVKQNILKMLKK